MRRGSDRSKDFLYFIKTVDGPVKIGRTCDIDERLSKIATACPLEIDWVKAWSGKGDDEKAWHSHFAEQRTRGEWFAWSDDLAAAIEAQRLPAKDHGEGAYGRLFAPKARKSDDWDFDRFMAHVRSGRFRGISKEPA